MYLNRLYDKIQEWIMEKQNIEDWAKVFEINRQMTRCALVPGAYQELQAQKDEVYRNIALYTHYKTRRYGGRVMDAQA